jgi:hypothetical protein
VPSCSYAYPATPAVRRTQARRRRRWLGGLLPSITVHIRCALSSSVSDACQECRPLPVHAPPSPAATANPTAPALRSRSPRGAQRRAIMPQKGPVEGDRIGHRLYRVHAPRFRHDVRALLTSKASSAGVEHQRRRIQGTAPAIAIRVVENDGKAPRVELTLQIHRSPCVFGHVLRSSKSSNYSHRAAVADRETRCMPSPPRARFAASVVGAAINFGGRCAVDRPPAYEGRARAIGGLCHAEGLQQAP